MELLETPLKKESQPWMCCGWHSALIKSCNKPCICVLSKRKLRRGHCLQLCFSLGFDLLPPPHVSPMFLEGMFGILLLDGAFGIFSSGSFKEFAARDKIGRTGRRADHSQHDPCQPQLSLPLSLLPPGTCTGLAGCATAALGQTSGKVHISHHLFSPFLPSPFPAFRAGFAEMFAAPACHWGKLPGLCRVGGKGLMVQNNKSSLWSWALESSVSAGFSQESEWGVGRHSPGLCYWRCTCVSSPWVGFSPLCRFCQYFFC